MGELPEWPERLSFAPDTRGLALYERARAEAALARLRVAVEALGTLHAQHSGIFGSTKLADCMAVIAKNALAAIGEVPQ